jgi:hypothetical protein
MKTLRNTLHGLLITLVLIAVPFTAFAQDGGNYSGDDVYDLAAGALSAPNPQFVMNFSGDDTYDLAADGQPTETPAHYAKRFSGDDDYDSAAGGLFYEPTVRYVSNFSGDDAYDPSFDWTPVAVQVAQTSVR